MPPQDQSALPVSKIHPSVFIAETARAIGDVTIGKDSSVWFSAVLRGDSAPIMISEGTNIQDNAVIHVAAGMPAVVGAHVTIGHGAIVHAATVEDNVMIGMGAIILSGAKVGSFSIIAAGAVVAEGVEIPPRSVVMGIPGRVVRKVKDKEIFMIEEDAQRYIERARNYLKGIYE